MAAKNRSKKFITPIAGLSQLAVYRGLIPEVARQLGFSPVYVWQVAHGRRNSKLIATALRREISRREKLFSKAA